MPVKIAARKPLPRIREDGPVDADSPASRTALGAARHRAMHQVLESGAIFADPLAVPIVGETADDLRQRRASRRMRWFVCARARYAEEALARAVSAGVDQLVVLGAGLDTFGYRNPHAGLRVVEVDHPATQAWKRERLAAAGIDVLPGTAYAAVDFERDDLATVLDDAVDTTRPVLCWWLGVTPYLTRDAIAATLATLARLPSSAVVLDHATPARTPETRALLDGQRARVAALGEPWISEMDGAEVETLLRTSGFDHVEREDAGVIVRGVLGLPAVDEPPTTRLALATRGWPTGVGPAR